MEQFLVSALLLDEIEITAINFGLILLGGLIGAAVFSPKFTLRRVSYVWWFVGATLALSVSQFVWVFAAVAANAGLLSPLILLGFGTFFIYGIVIYYGAAARSEHITGDRTMTWMAFVPIANLWLFFKPSGALAREQAPKRSKAATYILDPILVLAALVILGLVQVLDRVMEDLPVLNEDDSAALLQQIIASQTPEESFAQVAQLAQSELPQRIDEITVLREVRSEGLTLRYIYGIEEQITGFNSNFETQLVASICAPEVFASEIARGGRVIYEYFGPEGQFVNAFEITQDDCTKQSDNGASDPYQ